MNLELEGKVALVTGATAGIGLSIARRLSDEGAEVVICGRDKMKLARVADEIDVRGILADVTTAEGSRKLHQALPKVDILVNNLSIYEAKRFEDVSDDDWLRLFNVNVLSGARLSRFYFPKMLEGGWGRIIFVTSDSALVVPPDMIHDGTTKTARLAISRGLAAASKGTGVTVNSVLAGTTSSHEFEEFLRSVARDPSASLSGIEREFFASDRPSSLIYKMVDPDVIANLVAYVASPHSSATNGATLRADSGILPPTA